MRADLGRGQATTNQKGDDAEDMETSSDQIRDELAKVLAWDDFAAAPRMSRVLEYIVNEAIEGRREGIRERTIAVEALGKGQEFDPLVDPIVRVLAGKLRKSLQHYYYEQGAESRLRISVPKGGYRPEFAWQSLAASVVSEVRGRSRLPAVAGATAGASTKLMRPILAVAPLVTFTHGERERFLADSVAQDLAIKLSRIGWIDVVDYLRARNRLMSDKEPLQVAQELNADYLLTGSIRGVDRFARVTVQLVNASSGTIVWAEIFDIDWESGVTGAELYDDIVNRIRQKVGDLFGVLSQVVWAQVKSKPLRELSDLEAVLHVFQYLMHLDQRMFGKAVHAAEQALKANPNFAWAWAGRAQLHLAEYCFSASPDERDLCASATDCLRNAMNADPACAYAHLVSGMSLLMQGRIDEMVAASQKAIDLAEGAPAEVGSAGVVLSMAGGEPDGQFHIDQSLSINPRLPGYVRYGTVVNNLRAGAYSVGLRECGQFSMPNCFWDPMLRTAMLVRTGESEAARVEWSRAVTCQPQLAERPREFIGRVIRDRRVLDDLADAVCSINAH